MKKTFRVGAILTAIGLLMLLVGFTNHGFRSVIYQNGFRVDSQKAHQHSMGKVDSIELATNQPVSITSGDVQTTQFITDENEVKAQNNHGTLKIQGNVGDHSQVHFLFGTYSNTDTVRIIVPNRTTLNLIHADRGQTDDVKLNNLKVKQLELAQSGAAKLQNVDVAQMMKITIDDDLTIANTIAKTAELKSSDGNLMLTGVQVAKSTKIIASNGDLSLKNSQLGTADATVSNGNATVKQNQIVESFKLVAGDGNIAAKLSKNAGIQATAYNGDLMVNGHNEQHRYHTTGSQGQYQLKTQNGDLTIQRK